MVGCAAAPAATPLAPPPVLGAASATPGAAANAAPSAPPRTAGTTKVTFMGVSLEWDEQLLLRAITETNRLLAQRSVPVELDASLFAPQSNEQVMTTFASASENTLMLFGSTSYAQYAAMGALADITDAAKQYSGLYATCTPADWKNASYNGRVYGFPLLQREPTAGQADISTGLAIRQDMLDEIGAEPPKTPQELFDQTEQLRAKGLNSVVAFITFIPPTGFHRAYDEWPFYVSADSMFLYDQTSEVKPYIGSSIFEKDCETLAKLYSAGRLLTLRNAAEIDKHDKEWNVFASLNTGLPAADSPMADKVTVVKFSPEKPYYIMNKRIGRLLCISASSKDVSPALTLLEAIYTDKDTHNAFAYGEKDTDWTLNADGSVKMLAGTSLGLQHGRMLPPLTSAQWPYPLIDAFAPQASPSIDMPAVQFNYFPPTELYQKVRQDAGANNVQGILNKRFNKMSESIAALYMDKLNSAGYAALIEDCQRQYDAFLGN